MVQHHQSNEDEESLSVPDSFLKAFDAHDTEPDAAVRMAGSVRGNNNDDWGHNEKTTPR
jgi:hypothetical protein